MRTRRLVSTLILMVPVTSGVAAPQNEPSGKSLYQRLGGYNTIAAVVNDFSRRFSEDPQLKPFIVGVSDDSGKRPDPIVHRILL